jgi:DNA primase
MEIAEIKTRLTLSQVLKHYGLKPDKNLRLRCPFHDDRTPSLQVYYKTHTCYCFSTNCPTHGRAMDVIDFILHKEGCTKHEAILKAKATPVERAFAVKDQGILDLAMSPHVADC